LGAACTVDVHASYPKSGRAAVLGAANSTGWPMSKAMEQIVDAYVRLNNRRALEDLRLHRQKLAVYLKGKADFDFSLRPIGQLDEEIALIERGLERLNAAATGAAASNEGQSAAPEPSPHQRPS
jgi:hypothetical protein